MNEQINHLSLLYAFCHVANKLPLERELIMGKALMMIGTQNIPLLNWYHEVKNECVLDFHKALLCAWIALPEPFLTRNVPLCELFHGLDIFIVEMILGEYYF